MSASIVIPTTLRRPTVSRCIASAVSAASRIEGAEVLVVANDEDPDGATPELPGARVIHSPRPGLAAARNLGFREARHDVVLFTDDDCLLPPDWCGRLADPMLAGEAAAVAAPLHVRRDGPITAFIDYQRIFYPPPVDSTTVGFPLGAGTGVRRALAPDFVEGPANTAGEDADFGCALVDAGHSILYVPDKPLATHLIPEEIESISRRFIWYGRGNAWLSLTKGRLQFSVPDVTSMYAAISRNELSTPRRFEEIDDDAIRELFAAYDLILLATYLVGFLEEAGRALGREIIRPDHDALDEGWREIDLRLPHDAVRGRDWTRLPTDLGRWTTAREGKEPDAARAIGENLAKHAGLLERTGPDARLDAWADGAARQGEATWARSNAIWQEARTAGRLVDVDELADRLRAAGIGFREGGQMIETISQGPLRPAAPRAA